MWQIHGWLLLVVVAVVFQCFSHVFYCVLYLVDSEMTSVKVDFPTEYRIHAYYHSLDFPQK